MRCSITSEGCYRRCGVTEDDIVVFRDACLLSYQTVICRLLLTSQ